jgi:electron transfer flavoprotein beta subunit
VVEAINEPRYPSFKGIMAAKSKPLDVKSLADLGVDPGEVGAAGRRAATMYEFEPRPPKEAGTIVEDDGSGAAAAQLADWMAEKKFV